MANKGGPTQIWRHVGGEGGYKYLDDMTPKELAAQEAEHRSYDHIAAADAASHKRGFEYCEQQQREERARKFDLNLRIGVFFDGTNNNASNSELGQRCGAHHPVRAQDLDGSCKPYMADPKGSYGNDPSNIAKLFDLYEPAQELVGAGKSRKIYRKRYIDGIGTQAAEKDIFLGVSTGRGETGVEQRVGQTFASLLRLMNELYKDHPDAEISTITFDIFGFSRGAAAARHFSDHIASGRNGLWGEVLRSTKAKFSCSFTHDFHTVSFGFVGLFDTVASVIGWDNFGNLSSRHIPRLQLYLWPNAIQNVVQLAARDEKRFNFALSEVGPDHLEITLPGVHSDLGGGYLALTQEELMVTPMQALDVSIDRDVTDTSIYREALDAKARWIAEGWPADMLHIVTPQAAHIEGQDGLLPERKRVYAGLQIKREVRGELSRVYLRVMHALAKAKGVPFDDIPAKLEYQIPAELQPICDRFVAGDYSTTPSEEGLLRQRYIHTSAHWNHPFGNTTVRGLTLIYINSPMEDGVRVRHPHVYEPW